MDDDKDAAETYLQNSRGAFDALEEAHYKYHHCLKDDAELAESEQWFLDRRSEYIRVVSSARSWLKSADQLITNPKEPTNESKTIIDLSSALDIPRAELEQFSGDPLRYQTFFTLFDELVDKK